MLEHDNKECYVITYKTGYNYKDLIPAKETYLCGQLCPFKLVHGYSLYMFSALGNHKYLCLLLNGVADHPSSWWTPLKRWKKTQGAEACPCKQDSLPQTLRHSYLCCLWVVCKVYLQVGTQPGALECQSVSWALGLKLLRCSSLVEHNRTNCLFGFYFYM